MFSLLLLLEFLMKTLYDELITKQKVTGGPKGLQEVTRVYRVLQGVSRSYRVLQGVRGGYRIAQGVTGGYNRKLGNYSSLTQQKLISFNRISRKLVFTIKMKNVTNPLRVIDLLSKNFHNVWFQKISIPSRPRKGFAL